MAEKKELSQEEYEALVYNDSDNNLVVDLTNVEEMKFETVPKGIYDLVIDQVDYEISKSSNAPMLSVRYRIEGGEYDGRRLPRPQYLSFSPKALPGTKTSLMRIDAELFAAPFKPQEVAESGILIGKHVRGKIEHEDYQGNAMPVIKYITAPSITAGGESGGFFGS